MRKALNSLRSHALPGARGGASSSREPAPAPTVQPPVEHLPPRLPKTAGTTALPSDGVNRLRASIDELRADHRAARKLPAARYDGAVAQLRTRKTAVARKFAALVERDRIPPLQANQLHARLQQATWLILETPSAQAFTEADAHVLHALLLSGQHHNRWAQHNAQRTDLLPPLRYAVNNAKGSTASVDTTKPGLELKATGFVYEGGSGAIAHESVHEAQYAHPRALRSAKYKPAKALDSAAHPRAALLELAASLPRGWTPGKDDRNYEAYMAQPIEMQAYAEQATFDSLLPDKYAAMPPFAAHAGMDALASMLVVAGRSLLAMPTSGPDDEIHLRPPQHRAAAWSMEHILAAVSDLSEAMRSSTWTEADAQRLNGRMTGLADRLRTQPQGTAQLNDIALTLSDFMDGLHRTQGHALHKPAGSEAPAAVAARFAAGKAAPARLLQDVLERIGTEPGETRTVYPNPTAVGQALQDAKTQSGFAERVRQLQATPNAVPSAEALGETVMRLAARLMGVDLAQLPAAAWPAVHLYDAPSLEFEKAPGLNAPASWELWSHADRTGASSGRLETSHEKRKARLDTASWQLHVPRHLFHASQIDKLEPRLAGLAADIAYTASAAMVYTRADGTLLPFGATAAGVHVASYAFDVLAPFGHQRTNKRIPKPVVLQAPRGERFDTPVAALTSRWPERKLKQPPKPAATAAAIPPLAPPTPVSALKTHVDRYIAAHPESAAAALRALVEATPIKDLDVLWHQGPRAEVKAAARDGSGEAREAYEARSLQRWQLPAVAFRRAVTGTVETNEAD